MDDDRLCHNDDSTMSNNINASSNYSLRLFFLCLILGKFMKTFRINGINSVTTMCVTNESYAWVVIHWMCSQNDIFFSGGYFSFGFDQILFKNEFHRMYEIIFFFIQTWFFRTCCLLRKHIHIWVKYRATTVANKTHVTSTSGGWLLFFPPLIFKHGDIFATYRIAWNVCFFNACNIVNCGNRNQTKTMNICSQNYRIDFASDYWWYFFLWNHRTSESEAWLFILISKKMNTANEGTIHNTQIDTKSVHKCCKNDRALWKTWSYVCSL